MTDKGKATCQSGGDWAMNPSSYTEDTLVQQTTADYLEQQLGWESVDAYNNEDFGQNCLPRLMNGEVAV